MESTIVAVRGSETFGKNTGQTRLGSPHGIPALIALSAGDFFLVLIVSLFHPISFRRLTTTTTLCIDTPQYY